MEIKINEELYQVPSDLMEVPLGKFLEYYDRFGVHLDAQLSDILKREYQDEFDRQIELSQHEDQEALSWFSYWTNLDLVHLHTASAEPLIILYRAIKSLLINSEEQAYELPTFIEWKEQQWEIRDFKVTPTSGFSFNELLTSKEVVRQVRAIGKGNWFALPYLCCVFFRKKGESFSDALIAEGSERQTLMQELPMAHALKVSFFLSLSIGIWRRSLQFSRQAQELSRA
jgi:hypothetical protein